MNDANLYLLYGQNGKDIAQFVQEIKWSGRKGTPTRQIEVSLIDDDDFKHERSDVDVEQGMQVLFQYKGVELFRGLIMAQTQSNNKTMSFTAYDQGIYLTNNKDTFCYAGKRADEIFVDCCTRLGIPYEQVDTCTYVIPNLTKSNTTAWDAIADGLGLEFQQSKVRHYVGSEKGKMYLRERRQNFIQWVIESKVNLSTYTYNRSIENIKTRVKLISNENQTVAERSRPELETKFGIFQEVDTPDESLTPAQINDLIDGMLNKQSRPEKTISVNAIGQTDVISGVGVWVLIPELNLNQTFYVDEDVHTFKGDHHMMQLKLNFTDDTGQENEDAKVDQPKG